MNNKNYLKDQRSNLDEIFNYLEKLKLYTIIILLVNTIGHYSRF